MTSWPSGIVQVIGEKSRTYENTADAQKGDQRGSFEFRVSVDKQIVRSSRFDLLRLYMCQQKLT